MKGGRCCEELHCDGEEAEGPRELVEGVVGWGCAIGLGLESLDPLHRGDHQREEVLPLRDGDLAEGSGVRQLVEAARRSSREKCVPEGRVAVVVRVSKRRKLDLRQGSLRT